MEKGARPRVTTPSPSHPYPAQGVQFDFWSGACHPCFLFQVASLSPEQIAALSPEQMLALSPTHFAALTADQLGAIDPKKMQQLAALAVEEAQQEAAAGGGTKGFKATGCTPVPGRMIHLTHCHVLFFDGAKPSKALSRQGFCSSVSCLM